MGKVTRRPARKVEPMPAPMSAGVRKQGRPRVESPKTSVTLRLDPAQLERLDKMAAARGIGRSAIIQLAISAVLEKGLHIEI